MFGNFCKKHRWLFMVLAVSLIYGCGGGGSDSAENTEIITAEGQLVDSPVEGANYESGSLSGITGSNGEFTYEVGKSVRFFVGAIELGQTMGKPIVTLLDLASDGFEMNDSAVNMGRFLQSLDTDLSDERITIPDTIRQRTMDPTNQDCIQNFNFSNTDDFDGNATKLLKRLAAGAPQYHSVVNLVDRQAAKQHMEQALNGRGIPFDPGEEQNPQTESALARFASQDQLTQYLKNGLRKSGKNPLYWREKNPVPVAGSAENDADMAVPAYSTTNVQEVGVDEADTIETDGKYLYIAPVPNQNMYPYPETDATDDSGSTEQEPSEIRIMELLSNTANSRQVATIPLNDLENVVEGLYLVHDRASDQPDLLVTVGGRLTGYDIRWDNPWHWRNSMTEIAVFNVNDPTQTNLVHHLKLDGEMISSRRIGETLYVMTRYTPNPEGFIIYPGTEEEAAANEAILKTLTLSDILPKVQLNDNAGKVMVRSEHCFLPPLSQNRDEAPNLITLTAIDLNQPENPISISIAGPTETVYMATEAVYLATTRYPYFGPEATLTDMAVASDIQQIPPDTTEIHKFVLTENGPVYRASGEVVGNLGWEPDKKPFRMSHYQDVLRIATSIGATWNESSTTRLTLMKEAPNSEGVLAELSNINNIGETGENLYASRFIGDRCYLVTFRVTDPLYVFDLSDPTAPKRLGELHIDGYSDYLHPITENLLLGIGKDAIPDTGSNDFGGRGAWYQGVKLSLFDITDPANPSEIDSMIIGKRGTHSDALYDHHALAYLPPTGSNPARLALPIQLHDTKQSSETDGDSQQPWYYYEWTHTGLYLFDLALGSSTEQAGINKVGEMIVEKRSESNDYDWNITTDRSVILNNSAYYIHNGQVWSAAWGQIDDMNGPH